MPLFGGRRAAGGYDTRTREYVLTGAPIITADSFVVLVDLVVSGSTSRSRTDLGSTGRSRTRSQSMP